MKKNSKTTEALKRAKLAYNARVNGQAPKAPAKQSKRAKSKASAKNDEPKEKVQPDSETVAIGKFIAIGSRGTAFLLSLPTALEIGERTSPMEKLHLPESFGSTSAERSRYVGDLHAQGKACGVVWVDSISWIAPRGEKYVVAKLGDAIRKGLVKKVKATISRDNVKPKQVTLFVNAKFNVKAEKLPHCLATDAVKAGRVETRLVNDNRNENLVYKVKLATSK